MKNYLKDLTIIIVTYKSDEIIYKFIRKIPKKIAVIVVENSKNIELKKNLEKRYKNTKVYLRKNEGVSSSLNFGVKKTKTKYLIHLSPDLALDFNQIKTFFKYANKLNNNFSALGPRFLNTKKKGHNQINKKLKIGKINSIHGSYMFMNKRRFNEIGGWDKQIFLFFEETDYCYRAQKKNLFSYQINSIKVQTVDTTVKINNKKIRNNWQSLLRWHFIWSKFYITKKRFGFTISFLLFIPTLIRIIFRLFLYTITNNKEKLIKYKYRFGGLLSSILNKNAYLRLDNIEN